MAWKWFVIIILTLTASSLSSLNDDKSRATSSELVSLGRFYLALPDCPTAVSLFNDSLLLRDASVDRERTYVNLVEAVQCATQGQSKKQREELFADLYRRMTSLIGSDMTAIGHPKFFYALSNVAEVMGQFNESYRYLDEANHAAKRRMHSFDERALGGEVELAKAMSAPKVLERIDNQRLLNGPPRPPTADNPGRYGRGKGLIFIVGFPQSGMEYLERLLVTWARDGAVFSLNSDLAYYRAVADKIDSRVKEGFVGPYAAQIEKDMAALLYAQSAGDLSNTDWSAVVELVERYGASVEHNMHAVRAYALRALGSTLTNGQYLMDTDIANYKHLGMLMSSHSPIPTTRPRFCCRPSLFPPHYSSHPPPLPTSAPPHQD